MSDKQDVSPVETFEWTSFDSPSTAVVTAVAEEADTDPDTLEPLYEVIDPDALDTIIASTRYADRSPDTSIVFPYHHYRVTVKANGRGYLHGHNASQVATDEGEQFEVPHQAD